MRVTLLQLPVDKGDRKSNVERAVGMLRNADDLGDLVVLPELFTSGYLFDDRDIVHGLCEAFESSQTVFSLSEVAAELGVRIVAGVPECFEGEFYNSVLVIDPQGIAGVYRKISQTNVDKAFFKRGSSLCTFDVKGVKVGVIVCFDLWFPEIVRAYVAQGVELLVHPAAFGGTFSLNLAASRALENHLPIVTCNRVGHENARGIDATYCGCSQVVDGWGRVLGQAGSEAELLTVDLPDLSAMPRLLGVPRDGEISEVRRILEAFDQAEK